MTDEEIVTLYWERKENAISETQMRYGSYCYAVAYRILYSAADAEECVNDSYMDAWNSIPPHKPNCLSAFLGKLTRNRAIKKYHMRRTDKRGSGGIELILDELSDCIPDGMADFSDEIALKDSLNRFLETLSAEKRVIFLRRYWYAYTSAEIAKELRMSESTVRMILLRLRKRLKEFLEWEEL